MACPVDYAFDRISTMKENVYFFSNGMPRLLMSIVIAEELYKDQKKYRILLDQFGYNYNMLQPLIEPHFERIFWLKVSAKRYTHINQFLNVYFNPYLKLRKLFKRNSEMVLFGIRSPVQKFIIRHNRRLGNSMMVYAEGLAVDRYFVPRGDTTVWRKWMRRLFRRAFDYQHDYDKFHVFVKDVYRQSKLYDKLETIFDLYGSPAFSKYASSMASDLNMGEIAGFNSVFFGQPLSNFDNKRSSSTMVRN